MSVKKKSLCILFCLVLTIVLYMFFVIGEIRKVVFPNNLYRVDYHLKENAPVFYISQDSNGEIFIRRYSSSSYLCSANEVIDYIYLSLPPMPINIGGSTVYRTSDSGELKEFNNDEKNDLFFELSKEPETWRITADKNVDSLGVNTYTLHGDLSGTLITYASHGDGRMCIPAEWTDINEVSKPKLFNPIGLLIAIGGGLVLGVGEYCFFSKKAKR